MIDILNIYPVFDVLCLLRWLGMILMIFANDLHNVRLMCYSFNLHSICSMLYLSWNIISSQPIIGLLRGVLTEQGVDLDAQASTPAI
jgi:hypothetical protein